MDYVASWTSVISSAKSVLNTAVGNCRHLTSEKYNLNQPYHADLTQYISCIGMVITLVRTVSATICDALCCRIDDTDGICRQLKGYIECESCWQQVLHFGMLLLGHDVVKKWNDIYDVTELRRMSVLLTDTSKFNCSLTLQPCEGMQYAQGKILSSLIWDDKRFLSIAANFWLNEVSTSAPLQKK